MLKVYNRSQADWKQTAQSNATNRTFVNAVSSIALLILFARTGRVIGSAFFPKSGKMIGAGVGFATGLFQLSKLRKKSSSSD